MAKKAVKSKPSRKMSARRASAKKSAGRTAVKSAPKKVAAKREKTAAGGDGAAPHLTKKELTRFRELLLKVRAELLGDYTSLSNGTLNKNSQDGSGNLSKMPIHMADVGTDTFNQDMDIQLLEGEHRKLKLIDEALRRIDEGTYGLCLYSGKSIPKARLTAIPYARYTVEAQEELERKGELTEG